MQFYVLEEIFTILYNEHLQSCVLFDLFPLSKKASNVFIDFLSL